jgi:hypothetical protein
MQTTTSEDDRIEKFLKFFNANQMPTHTPETVKAKQQRSSSLVKDVEKNKDVLILGSKQIFSNNSEWFCIKSVLEKGNTRNATELLLFVITEQAVNDIKTCYDKTWWTEMKKAEYLKLDVAKENWQMIVLVLIISLISIYVLIKLYRIIRICCRKTNDDDYFE